MTESLVIWLLVAIAAGIILAGFIYFLPALRGGSRSSAIFVSFRLEDEASFAGRLCDRLCAKFGQRNVFVDVQLLADGHGVDRLLSESLAQCQTLIVIIGKRWAAADTSNQRKFEDPSDYVRREVAEALRRSIRLIPIFVDEADISDLPVLPQDIQLLARYNGFKMSHSHFDSDVEILIRALKRRR